MKNTNYLIILGWMIKELELSSNNLLTFALIYGFSQDGESEFKGSLSYICSWLNCSKPTAMKALTYLEDQQLIVKATEIRNNIKFNRYKIHESVLKYFHGGKETLPGGSKETLPEGGKETLPNITTTDNTTTDNTTLWREDYNIYIEQLQLAMTEICLDNEWIDKQQKYNPGVDIRMSIEKSYTNFWGTEAGWKNKKRKRSKTIDWRATFANAITSKLNRVYNYNGSRDGAVKVLPDTQDLASYERTGK